MADSGGEGKSKRAGDTTKNKERGEEPLGTMFYQTSSKRSRPFFFLIAGARKLLCFSAQSEGSRPWSRFLTCVVTSIVHED